MSTKQSSTAPDFQCLCHEFPCLFPRSYWKTYILKSQPSLSHPFASTNIICVNKLQAAACMINFGTRREKEIFLGALAIQPVPARWWDGGHAQTGTAESCRGRGESCGSGSGRLSSRGQRQTNAHRAHTRQDSCPGERQPGEADRERARTEFDYVAMTVDVMSSVTISQSKGTSSKKNEIEV